MEIVSGPVEACFDLICGDMRGYVGICGDMWGYVEICGDMWGYAGIGGDMWLSTLRRPPL